MSKLRFASKAAAVAVGLLVTVSAYAAQGCGPGRWRDGWGFCHGPATVVVVRPVAYSYGYPVVAAVPARVCPAGYWIGPHGHCRDTPLHGRWVYRQWVY
jgi:hypothetical protein